VAAQHVDARDGAWPMRAMVAGVFKKADAIMLQRYGMARREAALAV
jgi:hypothetical protein